MINRIHFHTFGGGLISREAYNQYIILFFVHLQRGGPMAGGGGGRLISVGA